MRSQRWVGLVEIGLALALLAGCAKKIPPKAPPSPTVDLTAHNATAAVVRNVEPDSAGPEDGLASLILPEATDVVVVHVERVIRLELNPLLLMAARKYVEDDCLAGTLLRVERVVVSRDTTGWIAAAEGDDLAEKVFTCAEARSENGVPDHHREIGGRPVTSLGFDVFALADDGVLFVGDEESLRRFAGPRNAKASRSLVEALPDRSDSLIDVSSRSDVGNAPAESSGYVAGTLERMTLHAESTVKDQEIVQLLKVLPMLKVALRPALEQALGNGEEAKIVLELIEELKVEEDGDRLIVDLAVNDVPALVARLWPEAKPPAQP
jgi:hypothetical protein